MTKRPGIRELGCSVCGQLREVETGIRKMYCCGKLMEEVVDEDKESGTVQLKSGVVIQKK